jgi:hypothetical protein
VRESSDLRHLRTILILAPATIAAVLWARSYVRSEQVGVWRGGMMSDKVAVYLAFGDSFSPGFYSDPSGSFGVMELETGTVVRRWLPVHVWSYKGDGYAAVQWWFVTLACAGLPLVLAWRKGRRDAASGFEVSPAAPAGSAASAPTASDRPPTSAS